MRACCPHARFHAHQLTAPSPALDRDSEWMLAERKLLPETVHLGVALLDRCLERQLERMGHARGRLLAIASLHAAAKYEESRESVLHGMHESPQLREAVLSTECSQHIINAATGTYRTVSRVSFASSVGIIPLRPFSRRYLHTHAKQTQWERRQLAD